MFDEVMWTCNPATTLTGKRISRGCRGWLGLVAYWVRYTDKTPLGQNPLGQNPLGQNPLGQNPLGQNPSGTKPLKDKTPLGQNPPPPPPTLINKEKTTSKYSISFIAEFS